MGKKEKQPTKFKFEATDDEGPDGTSPASNPRTSLSGSDEEANEDLSLKIVDKALLMRASKLVPDDGDVLLGELGANAQDAGIGEEVDLSSAHLEEAKNGAGPCEASADEVAASGKKVKKRKRKVKKAETVDQIVCVNGELKAETCETTSLAVSIAQKNDELADNSVLRKLLRGPRYFDPPDGSWGTCYNCGEEGHTSVNCTSQKKTKPCFICGSQEHVAKSCSKGRRCFICKNGGHRAKDCPEKQNGASLKICLRCGNSGHDMFSCKSDYSNDDLKAVQCYICKNFGHLCCVDPVNAKQNEVSCYKCGNSGHNGLACAKSREKATGAALVSSCYRCGEGHLGRECMNSAKSSAKLLEESAGAVSPAVCYSCGEEGHFARECMSHAKPREEVAGTAPPSICYTCGGEGHFARECTSYAKGGKRNRGSSVSRWCRGKINWLESKSAAPNDGGKKKLRYEEGGGSGTPTKLRARGGWMTADFPGDISIGNHREGYWSSPVTPINYAQRVSAVNSGGFTRSQLSSDMQDIHYATPISQGSNVRRSQGQRFSASRYGSSSNGGMRRNYDWW